MAYKYVQRNGEDVEVHVAAAYDKMAAAFKKATSCTLGVRSGTRSRQDQIDIFLSRYTLTPGKRRVYGTRSWKGRVYYQVVNAGVVGVPGTSNHEEDGPIGPRALDLYDSGKDAGVTRRGSKRDKWMEANAGKYGFKNAGYAFGEAWHKEYDGVIGGAATAPAAPGKIATDGVPGPATSKKLQTILHASKEKYAVQWVQQWLNDNGYRDWEGKQLLVDGVGLLVAGTKTRTIYAMQKHLGVTADGEWSEPKSSGFAKWQGLLNSGKAV